MTGLAAFFALDLPAPRERQPAHLPMLVGDVVSARAGVPELMIQMARSEGREDPPPRP